MGCWIGILLSSMTWVVLKMEGFSALYPGGSDGVGLDDNVMLQV
jgi:hypothetical protein